MLLIYYSRASWANTVKMNISWQTNKQLVYVWLCRLSFSTDFVLAHTPHTVLRRWHAEHDGRCRLRGTLGRARESIYLQLHVVHTSLAMPRKYCAHTWLPGHLTRSWHTHGSLLLRTPCGLPQKAVSRSKLGNLG